MTAVAGRGGLISSEVIHVGQRRKFKQNSSKGLPVESVLIAVKAI